MTAILRIQDGSPVWVSPSIVPSRDTVVSSASGPTLAAVQVNSNDVFVYVKVENPGTVDLGVCDCTTTGAWAPPVAFAGFSANPNAQISDTQFGVTFTASPTGDQITGPLITLALLPSKRRAWAWSPDGRLFALVTSQGGPNWVIAIVTLQKVTRPDGVTLLPGLVVMTASGTFASSPLWTGANFAWAGSTAVVATGPYAFAGGDVDMNLACPYSALSPLWSATLSNHSGQVDWTALVSPCAGFVAVVPKRLSSTAPAENFSLVSTAKAALTPFRQGNVPLAAVASTGASPSIITNLHEGYGVSIDTGNGATVDVDDPECTFEGGSVTVRVDRVKASTLPTANLGVLPIGTAVLGALRQGGFRWVQVPNTHGWANQSEPHWCLLAQAYTQQASATIPPAWDGQATNPAPFPVANENCAQRNIEIKP
jgi:hypothetical protein